MTTTKTTILRSGEIYGSTEGNATLFNYTSREGAVGYVSPLLDKVYPVKLVRFDVQNEEIIRDPATGLCQHCKVGEPGELLGLVNVNN